MIQPSVAEEVGAGGDEANRVRSRVIVVDSHIHRIVFATENITVT